jgi:hypothetical protein
MDMSGIAAPLSPAPALATGARRSSALESSTGFAISSPGNCVRNFAAASRIAA